MPHTASTRHGALDGLRRCFLTLATAFLATFAFAASAQATGPASAYDKAFLTEMVGHHDMAVMMGEMAKEKATRPELKQLAGEIVRTQTAEMDQMQSWLKRWYGKRAKTGEMHMSKADMEDVAELEKATGPAFDVAFMAMMSVHHTAAVERARTAQKRGAHPRVRKLAGGIIRAQEREIKQFRTWLVAWYGN